jgi:KaiC/GvpD/RAD55 family RecA-like ATPase
MAEQDNKVYPYDREFQFTMLALIARDIGFVRQYEQLIDPDYFDYALLGAICRMIMSVYQSYQILPNKVTITAMIDEHAANRQVEEPVRLNMHSIVDYIYTMDLKDSRAIGDHIVRFGKIQKIKSSILDVARLLDNDGDPEKAQRILQRAASLGHDHDPDLGINFFKNLMDIPYLMAEDRGYGTKYRIPFTSFPSLHWATNGGIGRQQVFGVMGYPGAGKSTLMRTFARDAIWQGISVLHYSICDLHALEISMLYAAAVLQMPVADVMNNTVIFQQYAAAYQRFGGYLRIKEFRPMSVTVDAIRSHISEIRAVEQRKPGLLIVDYPDKLKPSLPKEDRWTNEAYNIDELVSIAKEFDLAIWWAWHPTKGAAAEKGRGRREMADEVLTMADGKGAFEKSHGVDGVISLNRNERDISGDRARLWVDKLRRGKQLDRTVACETRFSRGEIVEYGSNTPHRS